jgi:N6-L-threonylcarbamoyladenine synthase
MRILAIESSCDDTACAIVEDGRKVLVSLSASQISEHKLYGGVVPEIASRRHLEVIVQLYESTLLKANMKIENIDAIAVTFTPGLIGSLLVGVNFAKALAYSVNKPLIPIHHIRGHIAANYLVFKELEPPFLSLVVSGGHTHIIEVKSFTKFGVIGRTRDDAAGEAFDKVGRALGFAYPGGVYVDKASKNGDAEAYKLPYPKIEGAEYDFSFSGLKSAVVNIIHNAKQKNENINANDLAASFQRTTVNILVKRTILAAEKLGYKKIALAGGVSANSELRQKFSDECKKRNINFYVPPLELCGDNAAMIAAQAYYEYLDGFTAGLGLNAVASMPIDMVKL